MVRDKTIQYIQSVSSTSFLKRRKGADAQTWPVLRAAPGLEDIWQLHQSLNAGKEANPPDGFIANLEPADAFKWIRISVAKDGTFTVTNTRNGFSKRYGK